MILGYCVRFDLKNTEGSWYFENDITLGCDLTMCCDELHRQLLKMIVCQNKTLYWFLNQDNKIVLVYLCFSATNKLKSKNINPKIISIMEAWTLRDDN